MLTQIVGAIGDPADGGYTRQEVMGILSQLLTGGSGTTSDLLSHALVMLLGERERWERLREQPEDVPLVLEETLRFCNPSRAVYRRATKAVRLGGAEIPAGALLWVSLASANRDEEVFDQPDRFDPHRSNLKDHFGFGRWTHFCLGAPLARLIGRIALERMLVRIPDLRLVATPRDADYARRLLQPKLQELWLATGPLAPDA
jgi:cytochrome P450